MYRISDVVENTCKKLKIHYESPHHDKILDYQADIDKLSELYLQLKEIIGDLSELEDKYKGLRGVSGLIKKDIKMLTKIDHDIVIEANKIIRRKERNK